MTLRRRARCSGCTTDEPQPSRGPQFGHGKRVYNVIDARQSYLQDVVVAGLRALGLRRAGRAARSTSPTRWWRFRRAAAPSSGIALSEEDRKRPYVEVSGRKGLGVKADDLMDKLIEKALEEVASRHPEAPRSEQRARRHADRHRRAALFPAEVHAQHGDRVRFSGGAELRRRDRALCAVRRGARAQHSAQAGGTRRAPSRFRGRIERGDGPATGVEDFWQMLLAASKADAAVDRAVASGEPAHVARYAFQLAQAFNNFYHQYPIIHEQNREKKVFLLWMTDFFRRQLGGRSRSWASGYPSTCEVWRPAGSAPKR